MLNDFEYHQLAQRIRRVLGAAKEPLPLAEIAGRISARQADVYDTLTYHMHGFVEMRDGKYRLL